MANSAKKPDWAEYKRVQRARERATKRDHSLNNTEKHAKFRALIEEAQALAAEINKEALERLNSQPLTLETARQLDAMKKSARYSFAEIYVPNNPI